MSIQERAWPPDAAPLRGFDSPPGSPRLALVRDAARAVQPEVHPQTVPSKPSVTVIMPLYNKRDSVLRAVESVLAQTFDNFELLVVDDGSTDGSGDVVRALQDPRIRLIRHENQGVSVARNVGILEGRGDLLALLDADDEWAPDFLAVMVSILEERSQIKVAAASYQIGEGATVQSPLDPFFADGASDVVVDFFQAALAKQPLCCSSIVMRRSLFASCGLFPAGITHGEDLDLWMRIGIACGETGLLLTQRTSSIYHQDSENRACLRRGETRRLPSAEEVLANRKHYDHAIIEYAYLLLLQQAQRLRMCGQRWKSLRWVWEARRTRHHRRRALREVAHALIDPQVLPS